MRSVVVSACWVWATLTLSACEGPTRLIDWADAGSEDDRDAAAPDEGDADQPAVDAEARTSEDGGSRAGADSGASAQGHDGSTGAQGYDGSTHAQGYDGSAPSDAGTAGDDVDDDGSRPNSTSDASSQQGDIVRDAGTQPNDAGTGPTADASGGHPSPADAGVSASAPSKLPSKTATCPDFVSGDVSFTPAGVATRKVRLWIGDHGSGPLIFYWHGTNGSPAEAETALHDVISSITDAGGVLAALYTGSNEGPFPWLNTTTEALKIADEVVACAIEKRQIDAGRIHAIGFSAGGLMTSSMSFLRSNYIASVVTYSGGTSSKSATFEDASNKFAALIFYGGSGDTYILNFQTTSANYSAILRANGNYTAMCNHGGGHAIPVDGAAAAWRFFQDHRYGTNPSPYVANGLPASFPSYCQTQP